MLNALVMECIRSLRLDGKEEGEMLSESQQLLDFAETGSGSGSVANRPLSPWGTCEDLLLASAVLKHGTGNWSTVSSELQARALVLNVSPALFSDEACKCRFLTLNGRFASCASSSSRNDNLENPIPWFEELRKRRVAQLKRELEHYDGSIGSLQRKLKRLKAERAQSTLASNSGGKQSAENDPSDRDSRFRSFDDSSQTEKSVETSAVVDDKSISGAAEHIPKKFADSDSKKEFSEAASEQPGCCDDHSEQGEATVKVAKSSQQAGVTEQSDLSSLAQVSDSHPSLESSTNYGSFTFVDAGRAQSLDVIAPDLPFVAKVNPGSSVAGVQNCETAAKARYPSRASAGIEKCEESVEAKIADAVVDEGEKVHNLELPMGDGLQAEVKSDSVNKEPESGGPSTGCDVLCRSGPVEADSKEALKHVERAECPALLPIEASGSSCFKRDDEKGPRVEGIGKEPLRSDVLERTSSGANAMDLLRLAYGSAQDATPVCTPEATDPQPQVESEAFIELDPVHLVNKAPSSPPSLVTFPGGDFSFQTGNAKQFDPTFSIANDNSPNAGSFPEVNDKRVPILNIEGDLNPSSNEETPLNAAEVTNGILVTVLERQVEEHDRNPDVVEESESIPDESFPKSQSVIEPMVEGVCEVDVVKSTSGNLSPVQRLSLSSRQEKGTSGFCSVQVISTEEVSVTIAGQCDSGQMLGFIEDHKPVHKQEAFSSEENFVIETEAHQSHCANMSSVVDAGSQPCEREPGSSIEEPSKPPNDVAMETVKPDCGTFLVGTGSSTPSGDVETKIAPDVSEEDGLLRDVMMLKPTKLSNLRKRQMLCNGGSSTAGFRNHMSPKESRSAETLAVKRVKSEDILENVTFQPKEVIESNSNSTVMKEESSPLKPRQFKLRSGRVKGFVKNSEPVAATTNKVLETGMVESSSETGIRDGCATEALPTQSTCPVPSKKGLAREDITAKDREAQDRGILEAKTFEEDVDKRMQDLRDDKVAEIATPANGIDEGSPPSKRLRTEIKLSTDIKAPPLLECLHVVGAHRFAPLFKWRQESQDNDRYKSLIRRHMDLNIVTSQLEEGMYAESSEFFRDLLLIFNNALVFYSKDSQEYGAARVLRECVMREMEKTLQTEAPQKISGRTTRKRELKKGSEVANLGPAATASEGKRRGSLRSSSSDHVASAASSDGGVSMRAADPGVERSISVGMDGEVENNSLHLQAKEVELEERERGSKDVSISYTRSKSKAKVQASDDGKKSVERRKDLKEQNGRSPDEETCAKKEALGVKKCPQNSVMKVKVKVKVKEQAAAKTDDSESSSKAAKSVVSAGRQSGDATTKKTSSAAAAAAAAGGRPPRNSQSAQHHHLHPPPPLSKGNHVSFQSQKRGRT